MIVFLDFEASGLGKRGFPIEVGWAAEDGSEDSALIRPAPGWEEWDASAERVHGIPLARLRREGEPHDAVARRMLAALEGHALHASAPSWDGHWLSLLLRASGLPRHALRLRHAREAREAAALGALARAGAPEAERPRLAGQAIEAASRALEAQPAAHRALEDARRELALWRDIARRAADYRPLG